MFSKDEIKANESDDWQISNMVNSDSETSSESQSDSDTSPKKQSKLDGSSSIKKNYQCPFCPTKTTQYTYLLVHVASVHYALELAVDKSQLQCHFCGNSFSTHSNMVNITICLFFSQLFSSELRLPLG